MLAARQVVYVGFAGEVWVRNGPLVRPQVRPSDDDYGGLAGRGQNSPTGHKLRLDAWGINRLACRLKL